jgi:hypothetical protein
MVDSEKLEIRRKNFVWGKGGYRALTTRLDQVSNSAALGVERTHCCPTTLQAVGEDPGFVSTIDELSLEIEVGISRLGKNNQ